MVSFTSKDHSLVYKDCDQFMWDNFERWLNCQSETISTARRLSKENKEQKKLKELKKDFQYCKHYFTLLCGLSIDKLRFYFYIISVEKKERLTNEQLCRNLGI